MAFTSDASDASDKVETAEDLTLSGKVKYLHQWIRRANEVLGIGKGDESDAKPADIEALTNRLKNSLTYLNDPLCARLEVILSELQELKALVG